MAREPEFPRYCGRCGEIFDGRSGECPECGGEWPRELPQDRLGCYAVLLTELHELRRQGQIAEQAFLTLRRIYEARLISVRPARKPKPVPPPVVVPPVFQVPQVAPAAAIPTPRPSVAPVVSVPAPRPLPPQRQVPRMPPPPPPAPPRDFSKDLRNWAARRQADLVLYLGAFLLSISALIFVSYQGSGMTGLAKSGLFGLYTALFLVLGTRLSRWRRVQEAGPIFVAIGAILAPLNFVALYTNVLQNEDVSRELVWLIGSAGSAALYFLLAWRGFGRFYWFPGAASCAVAYTALGACLHLPDQWYGPWFLGLAVAANFFAHRQPGVLRAYIEGGAIALAIPSLLYTIVMLLEPGSNDFAPAVGLALMTLLITRSAFPSRRAEFLGLLPVAATSTVAAALWSVDAWSDGVIAWGPAFGLAAGAAYLAIDRLKPSLSPLWFALSLGFAGAGLASAHLAVIDLDTPQRLPVAYAGSLVLALAWFRARRFPVALGLVPPLAAGLVASTLWSAEAFAFEWMGLVFAGAAAGYIALAFFHRRLATEWRLFAVTFGLFALSTAHAAALSEAHHWQLVFVYAVVALSAAADSIRLRAAAVVAVFATAAAGAASLWVLDVAVVYWALPALGLGLAIAATERLWRRDAALNELAWPAVVIFAATPILLLVPFYGEPWAGAGNFAASAALLFAIAIFGRGQFAAAAGFTSEPAARLERQMFARAASWTLFAAGGFANQALGLSPVEGAWTYAATAAAGWLAVALLRGRIAAIEEVVAPVGLTGFVIATFAASQSYGDLSIILGLAAGSATLAIGGQRPWVWRVTAGASAGLAILVAHFHAAEIGGDAWELPVSYAILLGSLLWDSAWNRHRPSMLAVPAAATAFATAAGWWLDWPLEQFAWAPLAIAAALVATERLWSRDTILGRAGFPYALALSLSPIALIATYYDDAPWLGGAAFAVSTAIWVAVLVRSNGRLAALGNFASAAATLAERQALALGAFALGIGSLAYVNLGFGLSIEASAWVFAGASFAAWAAILALRSRFAFVEDILGPASVLGVIVATFASYPSHGNTALILGAATMATAICIGGRYAMVWRFAGLASGGFALLFAHNQEELVARDAWQLPAVYAICLAALLWDSLRNRYQPSMLLVPAFAAATATAIVWWQDWPLVHMAWAPLAISLGIAAGEPLWMRGKLVRQGAWPYVILLALAPLGLLPQYQGEAALGWFAFGLAATAWAVAAWRSDGAIFRASAGAEAARNDERHVLALGAFGLALCALGHANLAVGLSLAQSAWTFAFVSLAALAATAYRHQLLDSWKTPLTIASVVSGLIALGTAHAHPGEAAAFLALAGAASLASGLAHRSSSRVVTSAALGALALAALWNYSDWRAWSLSVTYVVVGSALFIGLAPLRKSKTFIPNAVRILSVAPIALGLGLSLLALVVRATDPGLSNIGEPLVTSQEWFGIVYTIALAGSMLVFEGFYRKGRDYVLGGSLVLLLALELGIAIFQFENVQAHTLPVAIYLVGLGLSYRRSPRLFGKHMDAHELLFVFGMLVLVLPPAEQSFAPGGGDWGLLVIAQGFALLALGLTLFQRWLAVGGVVTLVAVATRFAFDNTSNGHIPYWVMLGVAGLALLGVGVFMLLERDWWDRAKARIGAWWLDGDAPREPSITG